MVFAYSSNAFTKYNLDESIKAIAELGFGGLEIMCDRPHLYPPDFDAQAVERVRSQVESRGLKITNLNCFTLFAVGDTYLPSWIESDPQRRAIRVRHTLDCIEIAARLGCGNISIPPGGPLENMDRTEALKLFADGLEQVIPKAQRNGVRLLVEPEPGLLIENSAQFREFKAVVPADIVGLNFDIGHFYCVGEDPGTAFEELYAWIGHVHLEDIAADRVHRHLIAGRGGIDFESLFTTMAHKPYAGDICLELYPYTDTPFEAGRESLEYLAPIFARSGLTLDR